MASFLNNRALCLALAAALLAACSGSRQPSEKSAGPGAASVFEARTFKLSKTPDPDLEAALGDVLSGAYQAVVKDHYGDDPMKIGFTYSMTPRGAVYPFSEIEVACIMQDKYARSKGPGLCGGFFKEVDLRVKKALEQAGL
ncbi:MAG TPA: hypothetical protein DCZ92_11790 [Elusimicrobia bacterium]|nr:MAG: hypothetical protein A2016_10640 [Elusimicrobia bacterium GWF2_62_30]HBA61472.1 hypothetical protein [Elusimicrobiota bacterium]